MKTKLLATVATAAAAFLVSVPAQAAVVNGGFETGDFTGWTQTGNTSFDGVTCPGPGPTVRGGNCSAFFGPVGSTGGITQTISTTPGGTYTVFFSLLTDGGTPSSFEADFGGNMLIALTNPPAGPWTDYQFVTTVTGSSSDLAFSFRDDPGFMFLDNISVVSGAVPEPGTWAMMLLGFGAMGLAIRRDRKPKLANALT